MLETSVTRPESDSFIFPLATRSRLVALCKGFEGLQELLCVVMQVLLHQMGNILAAKFVANADSGGSFIDLFKGDLALSAQRAAIFRQDAKTIGEVVFQKGEHFINLSAHRKVPAPEGRVTAGSPVAQHRKGDKARRPGRQQVATSIKRSDLLPRQCDFNLVCRLHGVGRW